MKRSRTLKSFYQVQSSESTPTPDTAETDESTPTPETAGTGASNNAQNNIVLASNVVVADPGLRTPIEQLDVNIRDAARREYLLLGPCQQVDYKYPQTKIGGVKRSFQKSWFQKHKWLEYSVAKDAAFCFYCFLFKQPRAENYGFECYTGEGFRYWKNATHSFDAHVGGVNSAHNKARRYCEAFQNQGQNVSHMIVRGRKKTDEEYLGRITIILGVVRFLLLQALPFRGHDESASSKNKGNFLEMIDWYKSKDANAKKLLDNALGNNLMTSGEIQKHINKCCATETLKAIMADIGDKNFVVLIDEARDASIKEQMVVILRYVNNTGHVIERFIGIRHATDTTSASLKEALDAIFADHGLSIHKLRGQGYDGASNMRGEFHGLQRRVLDENPYAFYIHCFAHQLQLAVVSVAKCCSSVLDFFNYTNLIVNTVNSSCKKHDQLAQQHHDNLVHRLETGEIFSGRGKNQETNLARPGDTRWGSHHKTLCRLQLMWDAVLEVLENMCEDVTNETQKTTATGLLEKMESFEFVLVLHLMIKILGKTNDLSQCLQRKDQNIVRALGLVGTTLQKINDIRQHGWDDLFEEAKSFCLKHNIVVPNMTDQIAKRGRSRSRGGQFVTYLHHFSNEIFNVVLDQIIVELNNRFPERSTQLLRCIAYLDPRNSFVNYDEDKLIELAKIYADDFSEYDCIVLREQLDTFICDARSDLDFSSCSDLGNLAVKMVQSDRHIVFPLVYRLIELALILPVATATVERAFSAMNIIKTELRNKMNDEWMNHCMICYIERDVFTSIEDRQIIEHYHALRTRKHKLPISRDSASGSLPTVEC